MRKSVKSVTVAEFQNTYMHSTIEVGPCPSYRGNQVALLEAEHGSLVRVHAGAVAIYMDEATARSLALQILRVSGLPVWSVDDPSTGGTEVDRWTEDVIAGAIGGSE